MDTEQGRFLGLLNEARSGNVRRDHALFNQLVRIVTLSLFNAFNTAFSIEDEFSFFTLK